jgi:hypothetical protein
MGSQAFPRSGGMLLCVLSLIAAAAVAAAPPEQPLTEIRVTVEAKGKPLPAVLHQIEAQAGVRLSAVRHLADARATVFVRDRPLPEVLAALAALWSLPDFPAEWREQDGGPSAFELWQDPRAAQELDRLLAADRRHLGTRLNTLVRLAGRPGDRVPAKTGDPVVDSALRSDNQWKLMARPMLMMLVGMPQGPRRAVVEGRGLRLAFAQWPPHAQAALFGGVLSMSRRGMKDAAGILRPESDEEASARLQQSSFDLRLGLDPKSGQWQLKLREFDPNGESGLEVGMPLAQLGVSQGGSNEHPPDDPLDRQPVSPALSKSLREGGGWKEFADFQEALARQSGLSIVSDYHHDRPGPNPEAVSQAATVGDLLRLAASAPHYRWWSENEVLLFRNSRWYLDDLEEVPATLELRLLAARESRGYLTLQNLAETSDLNDQQARRLDRVIPGFELAHAYRRFFAWHDSLTESLRKRAADEEGLPVTDSNRTALLRFVRDGNKIDPLLSAIGDPLAMRVSMRQVQRDAMMHTVIEVMAPGGSKVRYSFPQKLPEVHEAAPG